MTCGECGKGLEVGSTWLSPSQEEREASESLALCAGRDTIHKTLHDSFRGCMRTEMKLAVRASRLERALDGDCITIRPASDLMVMRDGCARPNAGRAPVWPAVGRLGRKIFESCTI